MENNLTTMTTTTTGKHADGAANPSYSPEDAREFTSVIHGLARLSSHQGRPMVNHAVAEAARLSLRFCRRCGSETPWDGDLCTGCGRNTNRRLGHAGRADSIDSAE